MDSFSGAFEDTYMSFDLSCERKSGVIIDYPTLSSILPAETRRLIRLSGKQLERASYRSSVPEKGPFDKCGPSILRGIYENRSV